MVWEALRQLSWGHAVLLGFSLLLAFGFEFVNGFHDTANAVATVIYTRSLRPYPAVVWSGLCNMLGIFIGGIGVAYSIVHLLPVDLLVDIQSTMGLAMVLSLLGAAIIWNFGTWYLGLPASSSHALIGSIVGVGLVNAFLKGSALGQSVNFGKLSEVGLSLLISPLLGFALSALMLVWLKRVKPDPNLHEAPQAGSRPPWWVRGLLIGTCTGVSFAHGSNDGQKGMGLIMLILIGLLPAQFALNLEKPDQLTTALGAATQLDRVLEKTYAEYTGINRSRLVQVGFTLEGQLMSKARLQLARVIHELTGKLSFEEVPVPARWRIRQTLLELDTTLHGMEATFLAMLSPDENGTVKTLRKQLKESIEYVPRWVIFAVALSLGLGTMVGWQRIVVTVGEKIGKTHLTYSQGASAEIVAMSTIGLADVAGLPVSTTHVLSSGVAGTMWANQSGINAATLRSIAAAWILTLPASMLLSGTLFLVSRWAFSFF